MNRIVSFCAIAQLYYEDKPWVSTIDQSKDNGKGLSNNNCPVANTTPGAAKCNICRPTPRPLLTSASARNGS